MSPRIHSIGAQTQFEQRQELLADQAARARERKELAEIEQRKLVAEAKEKDEVS